MLIEKLHLHQQNNLHRTRPLRKLNDGACDFISSDYLALSKHPKIIAAYQDAISHYGFGSLASPVVSGYYTCHRALEEKIS